MLDKRAITLKIQITCTKQKQKIFFIKDIM